MVVRWDEAIPSTADKLSSPFVHSAESRTDILEAVFYDLEGCRLHQQGSSIFYLSPAVTTIPALGSLRTIVDQSHPLRLGERRAKKSFCIERHEILNLHLHQLAEHHQPCDPNTIWYADASRKSTTP